MYKNILRIADVQERIGVSRGTIYTFINNGTFPQKIQLGARAVGFLSSDIDAWLDERIEASKVVIQ